MDIKQIRQLIRAGHSVVLVQEGELPLVVSELQPTAPPEEIPIAARWPKASPEARPSFAKASEGRQDQVLERLNKEILALKEQIAQDEVS